MQLPVGNLRELGPGQDAVGVATPATPSAPRPGWPAKSTLDYHKTLIELLLLVLAVPWILKQLLKHPGQVSHAAARHHLKGG